MKEFITGLKTEFTHITWPGAQEAFWLSILVIVIALLVGYYLGLFDALFAWVLRLLIS
ncbi:MAG: preprotein translocase subunit SecE [Candidatus Pacebacteria bacterium]|nr:preprotein translocase subunit SecE [Candidatus Paceibacterota bacterium]